MTICHVLAVSDRTDRCEPVSEQLRLNGARITVVAPGIATLLAISELRADVVVIDADHADGCRDVLLAGQHARRPVVLAITDAPESTAAERCLVAGAIDILTWSTDPARLARIIIERRTHIPDERRRAICGRRREALARLAASESPDRTVPAVRIIAVERSARSVREDPRAPRDLGPAQRRLIQGLREGHSCPEIAERAGVTPSAVYGARRRLAKRLGVPMWQVTDTLIATA